jgi:tRNA threonylcarbamoyladenosine biosynthesis protein TsaB
LKLALDTSQSSGSIALWDAGRVVYSACFDVDITHSETLMPQVDAAFKLCGYSPEALEAVLVTKGPGSFTGLRIGLATAKGIAYGLKIPLLAFSTLKLAALQRYNCGRDILAVLDAKMKETYAAKYDEHLHELYKPQVCPPAELMNWGLQDCYLLGSGAVLVQPLFQKAGISMMEVPAQPLSAAGLFVLEELFPQEERYDLNALAALEPEYLRESTAQIRRGKGSS